MSIFHPVDARTEEGRRAWKHLRLGIPTSSSFDRILTPKRLELSSQYSAYMNELLEEWITGEEIDNPQSEWMTRGIEDEDLAVASYESIYDIETTPGGFYTTDDGMLGASPDRLVGDVGDLEIKTGAVRTMVEHVLRAGTLGEKHMIQVQGRLMIHEREWVEVFGFNRVLMPKPVRVYRDDKIIGIMKPALREFVDKMLEARLKLSTEYGPFTRPEPTEPQGQAEFLTEEDGEAIIAALRGRE